MGKHTREATASWGFTLIEVMLSIAILASITALMWASFSIGARARGHAEEITQRYQQVRLGMNRMARELSMAFLSKNQPLSVIVPRTLFVSVHHTPVDELTFSSLSHMRLREDAKESDQCVLRYFGAPDPEDRHQMNVMRRESRRLGGDKPGEEGPAYVLIEGIKELHFEYFDEQANEWRDSWNTRSADGQPDRLPSMIRIRLKIVDEQGKDLTLRTATRTQLRDPLWFIPGT